VASPVKQFEVNPIIPIEVGGLDISFTNSAAFMLLAVLVTTVLTVGAMRHRAVVPDRVQAMVEVFYEFVDNMVYENAGDPGRRYLPFFFSMFSFLLLGDLFGMLPWVGYTFTSHIIILFALALFVFVSVTAIGFWVHGLHFFRMFLPPSVPGALAPLIVPIEIISYLSRPFSLSIRLFANMTAGHVMLKVVGGFVVGLGIVGGILPLVVLLGISLLEFGIAVVQAYVFTVLSVIYLNDALHLH